MAHLHSALSGLIVLLPELHRAPCALSLLLSSAVTHVAPELPQVLISPILVRGSQLPVCPTQHCGVLAAVSDCNECTASLRYHTESAAFVPVGRSLPP